MKKNDLIEAVQKMTGKTAEETQVMVDATLGAMAEIISSGEKLQIADFGVFESKSFKERQGRNPYSGETITIPETIRIKFKPYKGLDIYKTKYCK